MVSKIARIGADDDVQESETKMLQALLNAAPAKREVALRAALMTLADGTAPERLLVAQAGAARMLGVSRFTIRRMVNDGSLVPVMIRGLRRYRVDDLRRLANDGKTIDVA